MGWNRRVVSSKPTVPKPQQLRMRGKEGSYPGGFGDPCSYSGLWVLSCSAGARGDAGLEDFQGPSWMSSPWCASWQRNPRGCAGGERRSPSSRRLGPRAPASRM